MTPEEQVALAQLRSGQAKALLDNPIFIEAFTELEKRYMREIRSSAPEDTAAREASYRQVLALDEVKGHIESCARGGAVAAFNNRSALKRRGK
jgi:hypothetical protein